MTFAQLYGDELTRELASADTTRLFTTARRKAAINAAQLEFLERTDCLQRQVSIALSDGVAEYDLEAAITDVHRIAKNGLSLAIDNGTTTRYIEGDDLTETTIERLQAEQPNWRAVSDGTPTHYYLRRAGGAVYLGLSPGPSISGDTWTLLVTAVVIPADLSSDVDVPFTVSSNALASLRPYHRALAHFAAADLEKLRKDTQRTAIQLQLFESYVQRYLASLRPKQGQRIRLVRDYRRASAARGWRSDPRYC